MRRIVLVSIAVVAIVVLSILVFLSYHPYAASPSKTVAQKREVVIVDALGRKVSLKVPVERVVVTDDEVAELVQLLGAADRVVGIEPSIKKRGYFPLMADKPVTGSQFRGLNYELIAKLKPDVVIMMNVGPVGKIIKKLDEIGVKCIVISIKPEDIPQTIEILGKIFGKEDRAKKLLEWWNSKWEELEERIKPYINKTVVKAYVGMLFSPTNTLPLRTHGRDAKWDYIFRRLGIVNIADKILPSHGNIDPEYIVKENPDIVIIADYSDNYVGYLKKNCSLANEFLAKILSDKRFSEVKAFREKKVFVIHYIMLGSFRSVIGAYYLAKILYPEAMKDINPVDIQREYFEKWLGVPYKGVWFCPRTWLGENLGGQP